MLKTIHIDNIERTFAKTGNEKFVLISGKEKFQFWGTEQGVASDMLDQFTDLGVRPNMDVEIEYLESPESFVNAKGDTVNWTQRSIRGIFPANGTPATPMAEKPASVANIAPQGNSNNEFWEKKAYKQCLWNYWLENKWFIADVVKTAEEFEKVWTAFNLIDQDANKRFSGELPTIQQDEPLPEEVNVDDIPF